MKKTFSHYYLPSEKDFPKLWEKCLFVLDTNILLNLYRFPEEARKDLLNILSIISDRLWIPFQVALEFQENRLSVIVEQKNSYKLVKDAINTAINQLETSFANLQLRKRHSSINPDRFLKGITHLTTKFTDELDALYEKQPNVSDKDELRDKIDALFLNKIGTPPTSDELKQIYNEGEIRNELKRPPGYRDIHKDKKAKKFYFYKNLELQRKFGDLLIWKQIIKKAKADGHKYIVFITDDGKEDWWLEINGKIIGANPELIEEITNEADVTTFHMYNSEQFMKYAKEFLRIHLNENSLDQVRDIVNLKKYLNLTSSDVDKEIFRWLKNKHVNCFIEIVANKIGKFFRVRIGEDYFVYRLFYTSDIVSEQTAELINFIDHYNKNALGTMTPIVKENNFEIIVATPNSLISQDLSDTLMKRNITFPITVGSVVYDEDFGAHLFEPYKLIQPPI